MAGVGNYLDILAKIGSVADAVNDYLPHLEDEATVEVVGQPGASKKQLYFLALSAAFALVKRIDPQVNGKYLLPPPGMIMVEYDAADHWVRATIRYKTALWQAAAADIITQITSPFDTIKNFFFGGAKAITGKVGAPSGADLSNLPVYAGPKCDVVGSTFDYTGLVAAAANGIVIPGINVLGIPASSTDPPAPQLPFAGKTILTPCAQVQDPNPALGGSGGAVIDSPNPKPPGDNRSRGAVVSGGPPGSTAVLSSGGASTGGVLGQDECCINKSMALIPLVFAALSDPGSYGDEVFVPPTSGPLGV